MVQKYYNTQETAEKFGITPAEVKSMLDRRELHGYRDVTAHSEVQGEEIDRLAEEVPRSRPSRPREATSC